MPEKFPSTVKGEIETAKNGRSEQKLEETKKVEIEAGYQEEIRFRGRLEEALPAIRQAISFHQLESEVLGSDFEYAKLEDIGDELEDIFGKFGARPRAFSEAFENAVGMKVDENSFEGAFAELPDEKIQEAWQNFVDKLSKFCRESDEAMDELPAIEISNIIEWAGVPDQLDILNNNDLIQKLRSILPELPPDRNKLAEFLKLEGKIQKGKTQEKTEEHREPKIEITDDADASALEEMFGKDWKVSLFNLVPEQFRGLVGNIKIDDRFHTFRNKDGKECEATGLYNHKSRELSLSTNALLETIGRHGVTKSADYCIRVVFHEMGHAITSAEEKMRQMQINLRFLEGITEEERDCASPYPAEAQASREKEYRASMSDHEARAAAEVTRIGEDFAETFSYFFTAPDRLRSKNPARYRAMEEIMANLYSGIDNKKIDKSIQKKVEEIMLSER